MARAGMVRLVLVFSGAVLLAGCEDGKEFKIFDKPLFGGNKAETADGEASVQASATTIEKDVEAPEIFQKTDRGLWDGRPSLGGVWVAHPEVTSPERAIIRNESNGKFIIGALFKRERENPGPQFQVSSDAAAELGLLAGAPADLNVTVLRREVVNVAPAVAEPTLDTLETAEVIEATPIEDAPVEPTGIDDVASIAASAIEEATANAGGTANPPAPAPVAATVPESAPAPASTLEKPFVQIGIFSVQSNANETADVLHKAGVVPTIKTFTSSGKKYWRVVVGPAASKSARTALISTAKTLGFPEAYAVTN